MEERVGSVKEQRREREEEKKTAEMVSGGRRMGKGKNRIKTS